MLLALTPFLLQLLGGLSLNVEAVLATLLNNKNETVAWPSCSGTLEKDVTGYTDSSHRARTCALNNAAGLVLSKDVHTFHYAADKGYAGWTCFVFLFVFL